MLYIQVKRLLVEEGRPLQVHQRLLAGSSAGVIAQTTIYPMEVTLSLSLSLSLSHSHTHTHTHTMLDWLAGVGMFRQCQQLVPLKAMIYSAPLGVS